MIFHSPPWAHMHHEVVLTTNLVAKIDEALELIRIWRESWEIPTN